MRYVPYLYFLRVPILFAIAIGLLPMFGLWLAQPTIGGFFDPDASGVFVVSLAVLLFGTMLAVNTCLVLLYGRLRFFATALSEHDLGHAWHIGRVGVPRAATGLIVFYGVCTGALILGSIVGPGGTPGIGLRALAAAGAIVVFTGILFGSSKLYSALGSRATRWFARRLTWTPWGYLRTRPDYPVNLIETPHQWPFAEPPELLAGHGFALLMLAITLVFYVSFAFGRYGRLSAIAAFQPGETSLLINTLGSIVLLLSLLQSIFGGLAFLLDRYRVPILIPVAAVLLLSAQFSESDHFFDVEKLEHFNRYSPAQALLPRGHGVPDGVVLVAAAGGGIHAGAWTARVLSGLMEELNDDRFSGSIATISSVSGGSVGALYFAHAYENGVIPRSRAEPIFKAGAASSLDDTAWGLIYPDFWRSVAPLLLSPRIDRGWAMETSWLEQLNAVRTVKHWPTISEWREDALQGTVPL